MSTLNINDVQVKRGLSGSKSLEFTVSLSAPSDAPVTCRVETEDVPMLARIGSEAKAGIDYAATGADLTFAPGETAKPFHVTVLGTGTPTRDKMFAVKLHSPSVPPGAHPTGTGILHYGD